MKLLVVCYIIISLGLRDSICHCVGPLVYRSVSQSVGGSVGQYPICFFSIFGVMRAVFASLLLPNHKQLLQPCIWHPPLPLPSTLLPLPNIRDYASLCIRQCMSQTAGSLVGLLDGPSVVLYPVCFFNILQAFLHQIGHDLVCPSLTF